MNEGSARDNLVREKQRKSAPLSKDISSIFQSWKIILKIFTWFATEKLSFYCCIFVFNFITLLVTFFNMRHLPLFLNSTYCRSMSICLQFDLLLLSCEYLC